MNNLKLSYAFVSASCLDFQKNSHQLIGVYFHKVFVWLQRANEMPSSKFNESSIREGSRYMVYVRYAIGTLKLFVRFCAHISHLYISIPITLPTYTIDYLYKLKIATSV